MAILRSNEIWEMEIEEIQEEESKRAYSCE